jgi:hypothetical protein
MHTHAHIHERNREHTSTHKHTHTQVRVHTYTAGARALVAIVAWPRLILPCCGVSDFDCSYGANSAHLHNRCPRTPSRPAFFVRIALCACSSTHVRLVVRLLRWRVSLACLCEYVWAVGLPGLCDGHILSVTVRFHNAHG